MHKVIKRVLLTLLFVAYGVQASAMFIQPDWFDPREPGVGTNRYAYSGNDPVNKMDPSGNLFDEALEKALIEAAVTSGKTAVTVGAVAIGTALGSIAAIVTPTPLNQAGRIDVELTPDDYAEGYYFDADGTLSRNGLPVDSSELPSQRSLGSATNQVVGTPGTQADFDEARYRISDSMERDAFTGKTLDEVADRNGWAYDPAATKRNKGRRTYRTEDGTFRAADRTHGQFEVHDKRGKHQGQEDIDGERTKDRDSGYDF